MPPSAHDVARLAGVSQAAVSRAFTPGASISKRMRAKVVESAEALGYQPNLLARSLIKGRSEIIGVVIGRPLYSFFMATFGALSAQLSEAGKHILVYTAETDSSVDGLVENLLRFRVDAVFLMAAAISPRLAEQCTQLHVPVMSFRAARDIPGFSSISGNNLDGGAQIAAHLLEAGYRSFAIISGLANSATSREREKGFVDYLAGQGFAPPDRIAGDLSREGGIDAARSLLSRPSRPEAIFCVNDLLAIAAMEVARFEFGVEIGRELGIAGFDDAEQSAWPSFDLTSYAVSVDALVGGITYFLLEHDAAEMPVHTIIDGELKPRGSTRRG